MQRDPRVRLASARLEGVHDERLAQKLLLDYELTLGYVNRKQHGDRISFVLRRLRAARELRTSYAWGATAVGGAGDSGTTAGRDRRHVSNEIARAVQAP